jgi:hypothetical protein
MPRHHRHRTRQALFLCLALQDGHQALESLRAQAYFFGGN